MPNVPNALTGTGSISMADNAGPAYRIASCAIQIHIASNAMKPKITTFNHKRIRTALHAIF